MLPLSLISNIWLFDFLPPPCSCHSPDSPQSLCRSIHVYMLSGSFADNLQDPFLASLHFDVGHLWKDHRLPRKKGIFVHRMFAYKTTKELCFCFLSRHRCTLLSLPVVCDCLRQRRAGQVQQHFGGDHRPPAFADSNLQSGGIQVRLCGNSSCEVTPSFMQPVGLFLKYTLHNLGCDNKMRLEPIFLNTTCVVSVIEDFLTDCLWN